MVDSAYDHDRDDPTFIDDLEASHESVRRVAAWLSGQGLPVVLRPTFVRPISSERFNYSDSGDLEILRGVEVKRRVNLTFTCPEDFPYPTLIIDAADTYDRKRPRPYAYVICNREVTAAFVCYVRETFSSWVRVNKHDKAKKRHRDFYECPISLLRFVRL